MTPYDTRRDTHTPPPGGTAIGSRQVPPCKGGSHNVRTYHKSTAAQTLEAFGLDRLVDDLASDDQVILRRYLPIDTDPVRPAGISSTDEEHNAAIDRARSIERHLVAHLGFPRAIVGDSSNGGHVLPRIELPNDDAARLLVERCLQALDLRFSDECVVVDVSVSNAARVWKLYGTVAGKGDSLPERPHRVARLLDVPESVEIVPIEKLQALAAMAPEPQDVNDPSHEHRGAFDLDRWIKDHNLDASDPRPWRDGRKWVFRARPWNPLHGDYIRKPIFGREGANLQVFKQGKLLLATDGPYEGPSIYQEVWPLPCFDRKYYACTGSWIVNGWACGIGIREDESLITGNFSRFVPHLF